MIRRNIRNRLKYLAFRSDLEGTRFTLALGAVFIGLGFMWPTPIFPTPEQIAAGSGRHTYAIMAAIAPEWLWAICFLCQGGVMLFSLLTGYRTRALLWLDAVLGVVLWTAAIGACYLAYWRGFDRLWDYRPPPMMGLGALHNWPGKGSRIGPKFFNADFKHTPPQKPHRLVAEKN
jgi:hypothetical protein